jgi:hypothetical protein
MHDRESFGGGDVPLAADSQFFFFFFYLRTFLNLGLVQRLKQSCFRHTMSHAIGLPANMSRIYLILVVLSG